jgi:hypothetical protein
VNWNNAVHARNDANAKARQDQWNKIYDMVAAYGERRRAEDEAEKARKFQAEEAEKQRAAQAALQAASIAAQAEENAKNRQAQNAYNASLKAAEQAKQDRLAMEKAQTEYASLLKEPETPGRNLRMEQIRQSFPGVDQYTVNGETHSLFADTQQANKDNDAYLNKVALYKAGLPVSYADQNAVQAQIADLDKQGFNDKERTDILNSIMGVKTGQAQAAQGFQTNAINRSIANANEQADKQKAFDEALRLNNSGKGLTTEQRTLLVNAGYRWDAKQRKFVK